MKFSLSKAQEANLYSWIKEVTITTRLIIPRQNNPRFPGGVRKKIKSVLLEPKQMVFISSNIRKNITIVLLKMFLIKNEKDF